MIRTTLPRLIAIQLALLGIAACTVEEPARAPAETAARHVPAPVDAPGGETVPAATAPLVEQVSVTASPTVDAERTVDDATEPTETTPEPLPDDLVAAGRRAWAEGDRARAAMLLEAAVERGEADDYDRYLLGLAYWKTGRLDQAEAVLVDLAWSMDGFVGAPLNLARVRLDRGDVKGAQDAVERALAIAPDAADVLNVLGRVHLARGDLDAAADAFRRAMEADPANPWPANNLGYVHLIVGEARKASGLFEQAVAADPGLAVAWHNLALAREQAGDLPGARDAARTAAELRGEERDLATLARLEALVPAGAAPDAVAEAAPDADTDASAQVVALGRTDGGDE
ncbi:MAG: tetratricopeptide repeat protein [Acidobacteria bacterium]|nr:MAG: tetratricopeptide repeat protein [Acidobacteriota bacterium]